MFYGLEVSDNNILIKKDGKALASISKRKFADFCYGVSCDVACLSLNSAFLTSDANDVIKPRPGILAQEFASLFNGKRTLRDDLKEGWRLSLLDVDYDALGGVLDDFISVPVYNFTLPLYPPETVPHEIVEGETSEDSNYGDLLIRFKRAAEGYGTLPDVDKPELLEEAELNQVNALLSKKAIGEIEDKGAYRIIHFKPEYDHIGHSGSKLSWKMETPLEKAELEAMIGRDKGAAFSAPKP